MARHLSWSGSETKTNQCTREYSSMPLSGRASSVPITSRGSLRFASRKSIIGRTSELELVIFGKACSGGILPRIRRIEQTFFSRELPENCGIRHRLLHLEEHAESRCETAAQQQTETQVAQPAIAEGKSESTANTETCQIQVAETAAFEGKDDKTAKTQLQIQHGQRLKEVEHQVDSSTEPEVEAAPEKEQASLHQAQVRDLNPNEGKTEYDDTGQSMAQMPMASEHWEECSDVTDPDMPEMVPVENEIVAECEASPDPEEEPESWEALIYGKAIAVQRTSPPGDSLNEEEQAAEHSLEKAAALLAVAESNDNKEEAGAAMVLAIQNLQDALQGGCDSTVEAAIGILLSMLAVADADDHPLVMEALASCPRFPSSCAVNAARLLMLKPNWPNWSNRGLQIRRLCNLIALSNPMAAIRACLKLVPRSPSPDTLGFSWVIEPLLDKIVRPFQVGDQIVLVRDCMTDSSVRLQLRKGHLGEIRLIDESGDLSIRFENVEKKHWIFRKHSDVLAPVGCHADALPSAVILLCDDAVGPPACRASARHVLLKIAQEVGIDTMKRHPLDENLAAKARRVHVRELIRELKKYQYVSASE